VVTFLGHVDHGKTSLLDRIIGLDVVSGESGGITQHIRAYSIEKDGRRISFVDTPGHEAFTEMRARGANVTDIAVLVVAADDGVMPQTEEAISHARAAEVPIVVALNKIDLPGANVERAYTGLSSNELQPSEWGGDVEVVKTSATKGTGIDELLETVLTVAELHEYKANPDRPAIGTCLEAQQEADRGVVAKVLVQKGTLHTGDVIVCGQAYGRVKAMFDTINPNVRVDEAGPSIPVNLTGLNTAPAAGQRFYVMDDIAEAREIAEARSEKERTATLGTTGFKHVTLENLFDRLEGTDDVQTLNLILRADVRGSIEAIEKEFSKLEHPEVRIKLLQKSVGGITEADVTLADASDAIILGFNVVPDENARMLAEKRGVQIRRYDVIYKITDDLKAALEGMLKPEEKETELGRALVQQTFKISRVGTVAGCRVLAGTVERNSRARIIRDSTIIGDYPLDTLRREKDDVKEVREGFECGIKLAGFNDIKEGDLLEVYKLEEVHRRFDE
jgi:translation initiation factor IF-2